MPIDQADFVVSNITIPSVVDWTDVFQLSFTIKNLGLAAAGMSQIGYRDVYVLDLQPAAGAVERLYLDAKTYLPVRLNTVRKNGAVLEPVEMYYDDWRAVDGVQYPFSVSQRFPKLTLSFTLTEIRHNVPIEASLFEQPPR